MLVKTRGIVFGATPYGDSSIITRIYTEDLGLRSFMVRGARSRKSSRPVSLLQPLTLLSLEARIRERHDLHHITEVRVEHPYSSIPGDIIRSSQLLFLNELLSKSIREEEKNEALFSFLHNSLSFLDASEESSSFFHLVFALKLTRFLGFFPSGTPGQQESYFDLREGMYTPHRPLHPNYLEKEIALQFHMFSAVGYDDAITLRLSKDARKQLLDGIIDYYRLHVDSFGNFKSLEVLESVFS